MICENVLQSGMAIQHTYRAFKQKKEPAEIIAIHIKDFLKVLPKSEIQKLIDKLAPLVEVRPRLYSNDRGTSYSQTSVSRINSKMFKIQMHKSEMIGRRNTLKLNKDIK